MGALILLGCSAPEEAGETGDSSTTEPTNICINEVMPENDTSTTDETGAYSDWVELHNPDVRPAALGGWRIADDRDATGHTFGEEIVIPGRGHLLLWADGNTTLGPYHVPLALSGGGGEVVLSSPGGEVRILGWGQVEADFSVARVPDCCDPEACLQFQWRGTPGATNGT